MYAPAAESRLNTWFISEKHINAKTFLKKFYLGLDIFILCVTISETEFIRFTIS